MSNVTASTQGLDVRKYGLDLMALPLRDASGSFRQSMLRQEHTPDLDQARVRCYCTTSALEAVGPPLT